jgi:tRNA-dihydrouridine synthase A
MKSILTAVAPAIGVQNGMFGAIMMKHAQTTADCVKAMVDAVDVPVTVKHRIGVDDFDSYEFSD